MISRRISFAVSTFRNMCFHPQMNCTVGVKNHPWQNLKLFHITSVNNSKKANHIRKKTLIHVKSHKKDLRDKKPIRVWENMTAEELAKAMNIDFSYLKSYYPAFNLSPNSRIKSLSVFSNVAHKLGLKFVTGKPKEENEHQYEFKQPPSKPENLVKRPPVVTVMGHVDHGKTTLLDSLRNTFVTEQEFGGITQHIGAFSVEVKPGEKITFIDTPGHAAFTAMRARGAEATDIVVLVIAADDGVMQQTVESIRIANAAQVRLIIAVNKIDKPTALTIDEIKTKLLAEGVQVEDQGGDIQLVPISALKKINLDLLSEVILLEAELMNLKGDPTGFVEGVIIESKKEKMGIVATVIVKRGTLRKEKIIVAGVAYAKVRRMLDENGKDYEEALPSTPVQVFGWREFPLAGDAVVEVPSEKEASILIRERQNEIMAEKQKINQEIIDKKLSQLQEEHHERKSILKSAITRRERRKIYFEQKQIQRLKDREKADTGPYLNVVLKGDVYGTLEVLEDILGSYDKDEECKLNVVEASVGDVKQNDLEVAEVANAIIYAFNVNLHDSIKSLVREKNIQIHYHNVIYKLVDDLKEELDKRIPPVDEERVIGEAEVLQNFTVTYGSKKVPVAGAKCKHGELVKDSLYKVVRDNNVIYEGKLVEMRNEKTIVKTIAKGLECGLMLDSFPDKFMPGDKIICYEMIKVPRRTTWDPGF